MPLNNFCLGCKIYLSKFGFHWERELALWVNTQKVLLWKLLEIPKHSAGLYEHLGRCDPKTERHPSHSASEPLGPVLLPQAQGGSVGSQRKENVLREVTMPGCWYPTKVDSQPRKVSHVHVQQRNKEEFTVAKCETGWTPGRAAGTSRCHLVVGWARERYPHPERPRTGGLWKWFGDALEKL